MTSVGHALSQPQVTHFLMVQVLVDLSFSNEHEAEDHIRVGATSEVEGGSEASYNMLSCIPYHA